jgi:hypothetical protein
LGFFFLNNSILTLRTVDPRGSGFEHERSRCEIQRV